MTKAEGHGENDIFMHYSNIFKEKKEKNNIKLYRSNHDDKDKMFLKIT